ncbi:unnamed protein product, partial [Prorocentrum cordatum]
APRRARRALPPRGSTAPRSARSPLEVPLVEEPREVLAEDDGGTRRPPKRSLRSSAGSAALQRDPAPSKPGSSRASIPDLPSRRPSCSAKLSRACTLPPMDLPMYPSDRGRFSRGSMMWFGARDQARELFPRDPDAGASEASGSEALPAVLEPAAAAAEPAAARQGTGAGRAAGNRPVAEQFCRALARELGACQDDGEVDRLLRLVQKVTSSTSSDTFSTSGAQAYRLREALRPLRESSAGPALGYSHRLWVTRAIEKQAQRRRQQIASGTADKAGGRGRVGGLQGIAREERSPRITWQLQVHAADLPRGGAEAESGRDGDAGAAGQPAGERRACPHPRPRRGGGGASLHRRAAASRPAEERR